MQATQSQVPVVMPLIPESLPVPVGDVQAIYQKMAETLKNISAIQSASFKVLQEENALLRERIAVLETQNKVVNTKVENLATKYDSHHHNILIKNRNGSTSCGDNTTSPWND